MKNYKNQINPNKMLLFSGADTTVQNASILAEVGRCYPSVASPTAYNLILLVFALGICFSVSFSFAAY